MWCNPSCHIHNLNPNSGLSLVFAIKSFLLLTAWTTELSVHLILNVENLHLISCILLENVYKFKTSFNKVKVKIMSESVEIRAMLANDVEQYELKDQVTTIGTQDCHILVKVGWGNGWKWGWFGGIMGIFEEFVGWEHNRFLVVVWRLRYSGGCVGWKNMGV